MTKLTKKIGFGENCCKMWKFHTQKIFHQVSKKITGEKKRKNAIFAKIEKSNKKSKKKCLHLNTGGEFILKAYENCVPTTGKLSPDRP